MIDRAYLAEHMPAMVMWGRKDLAIPVKHAYAAKELLPRARLHIFGGAGHMPHEDEPQEFAATLRSFMLDTPEAHWDPLAFREAMVDGAPLRRRPTVVSLPGQNATSKRGVLEVGLSA